MTTTTCTVCSAPNGEAIRRSLIAPRTWQLSQPTAKPTQFLTGAHRVVIQADGRCQSCTKANLQPDNAKQPTLGDW